ncbi:MULTISPECIES: universal stress protein [Vibrio]|uniref:Universal stress protein n=1 Tax=Vibrio bivalvicida TaxID=1276888 RepID=A0A177Y1N6_9VIBR|nr:MULTISPECIES: universal stress protein [Vibrio]KLN63998.1 universal stress global response regulator UspA [Vibrio sp. VPAP30]OAJ94784.1 universal stress global response regulator UspA [Vibrio bivalvicida]
MNYRHILVALELEEETNALIDRAVYLAKLADAQISFIHVDGSHGEIYPELVDLKESPDQQPLGEHAIEQIIAFEDYCPLAVRQIFVGTGELADKLKGTIEENNVDLLICGHHHDFWSKIVSYSKHLVDKSPVDILVVPI